MTAVPPPVPPEIVRRAAEALEDAEFGPGQFQPQDRHRIAAERVLAAVYGDIVEAARRDDPIASAARTIRETGGAVEIAGVRIEPCDEYGATETTRGRDAALAEVERLRVDRSEAVAAILRLTDRVEAARRDALQAAARVIGDEAAADGVYGTDVQGGLLRAGWIVGNMARHGLSASVSDQGADPRTPTTPRTQIAAEGRIP